MIDSRDPGPILHGVMSLDLSKLEGRSGRGVGTAPLTRPASAAHRRTAETALHTWQTSCYWIRYVGFGVPEWGGRQERCFELTCPKYLLSQLWKRLTQEDRATVPLVWQELFALWSPGPGQLCISHPVRGLQILWGNTDLGGWPSYWWGNRVEGRKLGGVFFFFLLLADLAGKP